MVQQIVVEVVVDCVMIDVSVEVIDCFLDDISCCSVVLMQYMQQLCQFNVCVVVDFIVDFFQCVQVQVQVLINELVCDYDQQVVGLKVWMVLLEVLDFEGVKGVQEQIVVVECVKVDVVVLINCQMVDQFKFEYQKNLEVWVDSIWFMCEIYNDFQLGLQQVGQDMWVKFIQMGQISFKNLKEFVLGEFGKFEFKVVIVFGLEKVGDVILGVFGIQKLDVFVVVGMVVEIFVWVMFMIGMVVVLVLVNMFNIVVVVVVQVLVLMVVFSSGGSLGSLFVVVFVGLLGSGGVVGGVNGLVGDVYIFSNVGYIGMIVGGGVGEGWKFSYRVSIW